MMNTLFSLWFLFSIAGLLTVLFRRRFEWVIAPAISAAVMVLYFFGFLSQIRLGFWCVIGVAAAFWLILLLAVIRKDEKTLTVIKENCLTPGALVFAVLVLYLTFLYRNRGFENCDEFMHWGPMVLSSLKHNGFYLTQDILQVHNDYPPFLTLIHVLWCGFDGFRYSEPTIFTSQMVYYFACLMPFFAHLKKDRKGFLWSVPILNGIVLLGTFPSMTVTAQEWAMVYNSVYGDWILIAMALWPLFLLFDEGLTPFSMGMITLSLATILLSKQIGICYYLIIGFLVIVKAFQEKKKVWPILAMAIVPLVFYASWSLLVKSAAISGTYDVGKISLGKILSNLFVSGSFERRVIKTFLVTTATRPLLIHPIPVSYLPFVLVCSGLILYFRGKKGIFESFAYFAGSIGYALVLMFLYISLFHYEEAERLASYDRYMIPYLFFGLFIVVFLFVRKMEEKPSPVFGIVFVVLIALTLEYHSFYMLLPSDGSHDHVENVVFIDNVSGFHPTREDVHGLRFRYIPSAVNFGDITQEEFFGELEDAAFLYIYDFDADFPEKYWPADNEVDPYVRSLYLVHRTEDGVVFERLFYHFFNFVLDYSLLDKGCDRTEIY